MEDDEKWNIIYYVTHIRGIELQIRRKLANLTSCLNPGAMSWIQSSSSSCSCCWEHFIRGNTQICIKKSVFDPIHRSRYYGTLIISTYLITKFVSGLSSWQNLDIHLSNLHKIHKGAEEENTQTGHLSKTIYSNMDCVMTSM